jgi:hypothetical protein
MISQATIIGRSHRLMQQNCHDFAITGTPAPDCAFGLVLDGCGSKHRDEWGTTPSHNEVGAKLLGQFTAVYLNAHLPHTPLTDTFFEELYEACLTFLHDLAHLVPHPNNTGRRRFIATHLLCTMVGFVVQGDTAVFFWSGDGYVCHNGQVHELDSRNQPDYLAYELGRGAEEQRSRGDGFLTRTVPVENMTRLAVASDGWTADLITQLETPQPTLALQRWLNLRAKERGQFEDDGAIAIFWNTVETQDFVETQNFASLPPKTS